MKDIYHKYFEDFQVGEKISSGGRQITEADARLAIGVIGASHPLHIDPEYCASRPDVGAPIAQGSMILGYMDAGFYDWVCPGGEVVVIPEGYEKIRFMKPIFLGDVVKAEFEIKELSEAGEHFGRVTAAITVYNQNQVPVTFALEHFLVAQEGVY